MLKTEAGFLQMTPNVADGATFLVTFLIWWRAMADEMRVAWVFWKRPCPVTADATSEALRGVIDLPGFLPVASRWWEPGAGCGRSEEAHESEMILAFENESVLVCNPIAYVLLRHGVFDVFDGHRDVAVMMLCLVKSL